MNPENAALLSIENLHVGFGEVEAVRGVSLRVNPGERLGIVGESGAGKTLTAMAVLGLLPENAFAVGRVMVGGRDMVAVSEKERARIRVSHLGAIFQDPMTALNPVMRVGAQVSEALRPANGRDGRERRRRVIELLEQVGLPEPAAKARSYPHELSGGQRQRVMIAIALAGRPKLLVADEPTTALDATIQADVLALLRSLVEDTGMSLLLITHDIPVVASQCDRVIVMYGGRVMESGPTRSVLQAPRHPYTAGLLLAQPGAATATRQARLPTIPGVVPPLGAFPTGCAFRDRCARADDTCRDEPSRLGEASGFACWHPLRTPA